MNSEYDYKYELILIITSNDYDNDYDNDGDNVGADADRIDEGCDGDANC